MVVLLLRRRLIVVGVTAFSFPCLTLLGCGTAATVLPCPFELVEAGKFSATLPCDLKQAQPQDFGLAPIPGTTYQTFFINETSLEIFQFLTQPVNTLSSSTETQEGIRFDGLINNSKGDVLLKATSRNSDGAEFLDFFGLLANGEIFLGLMNAPLKYSNLLNSVDLIDTDGANLVSFLEDGLPRITEIKADGIVNLDDLTSWRLSAAASFQTRNWAVGDRVYAAGATRFGGTFFLTNTRDFVSIHSEFLGSP